MFKLKKKNLILAVVSVSFLFFLSFFIPVIRPHALNVFKYPLGALSLLRREITGAIFYHRNYIQNEKLKQQIDFLKERLNNVNEIYLQNKRLQTLLSLKENSSYKFIAARVIGRDSSNWSTAIIIDKGRNNGIKKDFVCVNFLGLVGKIAEAGNNTSKILLINDPNFGVSAIVQRSRQEGLVSGSLGGSLIMKYLSRESDIKISDIIVTSGLTSNYPKGLLIGRAVDVGDELSGLSRYAVIKSSVDLSALEEVFIIIP